MAQMFSTSENETKKRLEDLVLAKYEIDKLGISPKVRGEVTNFLDTKIDELMFIQSEKSSEVDGDTPTEQTPETKAQRNGVIHIKDLESEDKEKVVLEEFKSWEGSIAEFSKKFDMHYSTIYKIVKSAEEEVQSDLEEESDLKEFDESDENQDPPAEPVKEINIREVEKDSLCQIVMKYIRDHPDQTMDQIFENIDYTTYYGRKSMADFKQTLDYLVKYNFLQTHGFKKEMTYRLSTAEEFGDTEGLYPSDLKLYIEFIAETIEEAVI